jgi:hypothetical protein
MLVDSVDCYITVCPALSPAETEKQTLNNNYKQPPLSLQSTLRHVISGYLDGFVVCLDPRSAAGILVGCIFSIINSHSESHAIVCVI